MTGSSIDDVIARSGGGSKEYAREKARESPDLSQEAMPAGTTVVGAKERNKTARQTIIDQHTQFKVAIDDLAPNTIFSFDDETNHLQATLSWKCRSKVGGTDLDINALTYDTKGRFLEMVGFTSPSSIDATVAMSGDSDGFNGADEEMMAVDLRSMSPKVRCIILLGTCLSGTFGSVSQIRSIVNKVEYMKDDMAARPGVPMFKTHKVVESSTLFNVGMSPKKSDNSNCVVLYKIYRPEGNATNSSSGRRDRLMSSGANRGWVSKVVLQEMRIRTITEAITKLGAHLGDVYPHLLPENQRVLPHVPSVCANLSSMALPHLKKYFTVDKEGLGKQQFVKVLFKQLLKGLPKLGTLREASHTVAILEELFEQIDINGDGKVDWDEFTSFNIENGMAATNQTEHSQLDEYSVSLKQDAKFHDNTILPLHPIVKMVNVPHTKKFMTIQKDSNVINCYTNKGVIAHTLVVGDSNSDSGGVSLTKVSLTVHDLVYIPEKNLVAVACSDNTIYLYEEELTAGGIHRTYKLIGSIFEHFIQSKNQIKLAWDDESELLYSTGQHNRMYLWDLNLRKCKREVDAHSDMIMHMLVIHDKKLMATCSMDKSIILWGLENFQKKNVLNGHSHGVRKLAYSDGTLISVGFEYEAVVWDLVSKEVVFTLSGHKSGIVDVLMMPSTIEHNCLAVTLDDTGEMKTWDLGGSISAKSTALQSFNVTISDQVQQFNCILAPFCKDNIVDQYSNLFCGANTLHHFIPHKAKKDFMLPSTVLYNESSCNFIASVGDGLHLWDSTDGSYIRAFDDVGKFDICCATTDYPRQRRIVLGNERGEICMLNYITGALLCKLHVHDGEVTNVVFDENTKMIITTGNDNRVCVCHDVDGQLLLMRSISNCHNGSIASLAYSYNFSLIVTGGSKCGEFRLWDFQRLSLKCVGEATTKDVHCLKIIEQWKMIIVAGGNGVAYCWRYFFECDNQQYGVECLCRLGEPRPAVSGITAICFAVRGGAVGGYDKTPENQPESERKSDAGTFSLTEPGEITNSKEAKPVVNNICVMDDGGVLTTFCLDTIVRAVQRENKELQQISKTDYVCNEQDYIAELKLERDMQVYLGNIPEPAKRTDCLTIDFVRRWKGHDQTIVSGISTLHPPSFLSASADGFMTVWGLDGDLLGEMRMPNVDAARQYQRNHFHYPIKELEWNFPEEKTDVSKHHKEVAEELINRSRATTMRRGISFRKSSGTPILASIDNSSPTKAARLRKSTLNAFGKSFTIKHGAIKSPTRKSSNFFSFDPESSHIEGASSAPVSRVNSIVGVADFSDSKQRAASVMIGAKLLEKLDSSPDLLRIDVTSPVEKMARSKNRQLTTDSAATATSGNVTRSQRNGILQQIQVESGKSKNSSSSSKRPQTAPTSAFGVEDFTDMLFEETPLEKIRKSGHIPGIADAFSSRSIKGGVQDGVYDFEQVRQLRKIGQFRGRGEAYGRAYPIILPSQIDRITGIRHQAVIDEVYRDTPVAERPNTTGGGGIVGNGRGGSGQQQWRGYANLVREFNYQQKNIRKPMMSPAGVGSFLPKEERTRDNLMAGTTPSTRGRGDTRQEIDLDFGNSLADKLEDGMSESDDDDEDVSPTNKDREERMKAMLRQGSSGGLGGVKREGAGRLHGFNEWKSGAEVDEPLEQQGRYVHSQEIMKDAMDASDSNLNKPIFTPPKSDRKLSNAMIEHHKLHETLNHHIRHRTSSADQHIDTVEKRLTRKFSKLMVERSHILSQLGDVDERDENEDEDVDEDEDDDDDDDGDEEENKQGLVAVNKGNMKAKKVPKKKSNVFTSKKIERHGSNLRRSSRIERMPTKWSEVKKTEFAPHYQIEEIKHFQECFQFVDRDRSGEISIGEWEYFLKSMNHEMRGTDARRLFIHIDEDHNGAISLDEICKVVFNKASARQLRTMVHIMQTQFVEDHDKAGYHADEISRADLRQLFQIYDTENKKALSVKLIEQSVQMLNTEEKLMTKLFRDAGYENYMAEVINEETFVEVIYNYLKGLKKIRVPE